MPSLRLDSTTAADGWITSHVNKFLTFVEESTHQKGTTKSTKCRLKRTNVKLNVKAAWDANKEFFLSFTDAFMIEAILDYLDMSDILDYLDMSDIFDTPKSITIDNIMKWTCVNLIILKLLQFHTWQHFAMKQTLRTVKVHT